MTRLPPKAGAPKAQAKLRRAGLVLVLVGVCARVVTTTDPLPGWSLDPLTTAAPFNGLGPAHSMALALLPLIGLALVLLAARRANETLPRGFGVVLMLAGLGLPAVAWHGWIGPTACVENANTLSVWIAAIAGGLAAMLACRHPAERALVIACCAGLAGPLVLRAALQVYSEHPLLVEEFRADRAAFLASHGWTEGSATARLFERRLLQPEASAWFAMSNVYASVMVGCTLMFAGGLAAAVRERLWTTGQRPNLYRFLGLLAGTALAVGGVVIAVPAGGVLPKGAAAALVLGMALLGVTLMRDRFPAAMQRMFERLGSGRLGWWIGPGLLVAALLAVALRGMIGEQIGELSILFRWFYLQAATAIFADHPLWGVGPDGFQSAYLLAKNPLSPEEVSSPHSMFFDYLSMLGAFGLAWIGVIVLMAARIGQTLVAGTTSESETNDKAGDKAPPKGSTRYGLVGGGFAGLLIVVVASSLIAFGRETLPTAATMPDAFSLLLLDGLTKLAGFGLLWLGLGAALLTVAKSPAGASMTRAGLLAAGLAVLVHAQIELTGTDLSAAGWLLIVLGAGAGAAGRGPGVWKDPTSPDTAPARTRSPHRRLLLFGAIEVLAIALAVAVATVPVWTWQRGLQHAAARATEATRLVQRFDARAAGASDESPADLVADLAELLGQPVPMTPEGVGRAVDLLRLRTAADAADALERLARTPSTPSRATARAALRTRAAEAALRARAQSTNDADPARAAQAAIDLAAWAAERWPTDSSAYRRWAGALRQAESLAPDRTAAKPFSDLKPLEQAATRSPFSPDLARQLALRFRDAGDRPAAARWASKALELHALRRLDPLAGLTESQVQMLRELARNP
ncbi:MAG: O-antigen ligase family protein [Planctomycetota bacterium]|nr:O-antigen ligase family protein [Planctomycetota bacterium]